MRNLQNILQTADDRHEGKELGLFFPCMDQQKYINYIPNYEILVHAPRKRLGVKLALQLGSLFPEMTTWLCCVKDSSLTAQRYAQWWASRRVVQEWVAGRAGFSQWPAVLSAWWTETHPEIQTDSIHCFLTTGFSTAGFRGPRPAWAARPTAECVGGGRAGQRLWAGPACARPGSVWSTDRRWRPDPLSVLFWFCVVLLSGTPHCLISRPGRPVESSPAACGPVVHRDTASSVAAVHVLRAVLFCFSGLFLPSAGILVVCIP